MNEAENFCQGICYPWQKVKVPLKSKLRYVPTGRDLEVASVPLDTVHKNGRQSIDTHSLYAISEHKATHDWFASQKQRTMIITRSHFAGSGKWASTWLGDNVASLEQMQLSIFGVMMSNIFGMPLAGSDICGFIGDTTPALCTRWHFVGAFYPFSRNHNNWWEKSQEPYTFDPGMQKDLRTAIRVKYSLLKYYYTTLFDISQYGTFTNVLGTTLYKPLFFEFPDDPLTTQLTRTMNMNIMLGRQLKLSINPNSIETQGELEEQYYFPAGTWCVLSGNINNEAPCLVVPDGGIFKGYPANVSDYQLHMREGAIIPYQNTLNEGLKFSTSQDL